MNPVPYCNELSLNVDETDNSIDIELVISVAPCFGIAESQAKKEAMEITGTVKDKWEKIATGYGPFTQSDRGDAAGVWYDIEMIWDVPFLGHIFFYTYPGKK